MLSAYQCHLAPRTPQCNARTTGEGDQVVETDSMAAPSTTEPASNSGKLITECATTWSIFGFGITSIYTGNQILYAKTGDDTFPKFYAWILLPVCVTAQVISFLLKPRREDSFYKAFLYTQYFLFTVVSEILSVVGDNWEQHCVFIGSLRSLLWLGLLPVWMCIRARVARLSDEELSHFFSVSIVRDSLVVGLGQLTFLTFSSVQCQSEAR